MKTPPFPFTKRTPLWLAGAVLIIALLAGYRWQAKAGRSQDSANASAVFEVRQGPLTISFSQAGTIQALEQEIITCEVQGRTTIIYIIEEGSRVSEGTLLVELDASGLQDNLIEQEIRLQNAEASFIQAREQLGVTKSQAESNISQAALDHQFAKEDLDKYIEGEYKQLLREAESKITLARETIQLAKRKLDWSEKLYEEDYISLADRDTDRLAHNRAQLDLELAEAAKKLLEEYTHKRKMVQLESDIEQTRRALERAQLKANADIVQAEAALKAKEAELEQQRNKLTKIEDQIAKTKIYAPRDGLVVYATSAKANWRGNEEPLDTGQEVRERQELIYLPTADLMKAEIQVHESNLDKIQMGLPAILSVDALQGKTFLGKITRIAPLPDAAMVWMNPDLKVYRTEITIDGQQADLRTGMSCQAEVIIEKYEDALFVPIQAVVVEQGRQVVYVQQGNSFAPVPVTTGLDNNRMIHLLAGVTAGQKVWLTPPLKEQAEKGPSTNTKENLQNEKIRTLIDAANASPPSLQQAPSEHPKREEGKRPDNMRRKAPTP